MLQVKSFQFSPIQENTYVLYNQFNDCIIIDPGCYYDYERDELVQFLHKMEMKPVMLLATHCHLDHVFGLKFVAEKYNLVPRIHKNEKPVLDYAPVSALMFNCPFDGYKGELDFIDEKNTILLGQEELSILFMPGHSPGSIGFYSAKEGFVISGDVLFQQSIGRTDLPGGDFKTLIKSIKEKMLVLPDETTVYSGHGPATTIGEERKDNPYLNE